jgi:PAS domain S-box-containing protein
MSSTLDQRPAAWHHDATAQLRDLADHACAAMFVKDLDGRYLFVNREFERLKGVASDSLVGRFDREVFPRDADVLRGNDLQVIREQRAINFEEAVETAQGTRTYLSHKFPLFDSQGRPYAVCGIATDISGRKRSEDALRAAAIAVSSAEGESVAGEMMRSLAAILGVDVAFMATYTDSSRTMMQTLACCLDGRLLRNFEYPLAGSPCARVVGRDYRFVPCGVQPEFPQGTMFSALGMDSYAALPLNGADGESLGLIAVVDRKPLAEAGLIESMLKIFAARAIAEIERRRAVTALSDSEASYRSIFEASEDAIFVHDWDTGAILDVSPAAETMYGYSADELRHMSVGDISAGDEGYDQAHALERIDEAKRGRSTRFEWRVRHRSGRLAWHEVRLKRAMIAGKQRILAYTRDISASKAANEALRASEEQYRAIFEASVDGLVLCDATGAVVDANPAFLRMLGCARDEAVDPNGLRFIHPGGRAACEATFESALRGQPFQMESQAQRRDGTVFDIEVRGVPMRYRDRPHALVIVRDLTERRRAEVERARLEEQLRQSQKMEALGHLTGGIAHDFNNLLTSIMGYVALAAERDAAVTDPRLWRYLEQARQSCGRARELISQMLTFSRGRRGEPRALRLAPLVRDSVKLLRASFPASIELGVRLQDAPPVQLDPVQLDQVLMNLAINARDAIGGNGRIDVVVARATIAGAVCASCRASVGGDFVELAVADTGAGVPDSVRERMFEPFYTTKGVGKGTGMGLSTVHGIVHEHGGHLLVESASGAGARFRVLLPALDEGADAIENRGDALASLPREKLDGRVLVVEDEASVAAFMRDLLETWGLEVEAVEGPEAALAVFADRAETFDLVVTDHAMPGMTGVELAQRLTAQRSRLPVLLYTGYGEGLTSEALEAAGVRGVLHKPIEPGQAFATLSTLLRSAE